MGKTTYFCLRLSFLSFVFFSESALSETELIKAVLENNAPLVQTILNESCPLDELSEDGDTALHIALRNGFMDIAKFIISKSNRFSINTENTDATLPLTYAVKYSNSEQECLELIQLMVEKGAAINGGPSEPVIEAINKNWVLVLEYLNEQVSCVDKKCFYQAILGNHPLVVDYLLSCKLSPFNSISKNKSNILTTTFITPFHIAGICRNIECLDKFSAFEKSVEPEKLLQHYKESFDLAISNKKEAPEGVTLANNTSEQLARWFLKQSAATFKDFPEKAKQQLMLGYLNSAIKHDEPDILQLLLNKPLQRLNGNIFSQLLETAKNCKNDKIQQKITTLLLSDNFVVSLKDFSLEDKNSFMTLFIDIALEKDDLSLLRKILSYNLCPINISDYIHITTKALTPVKKNIIAYIKESRWLSLPFANNFADSDESLRRSLVDAYKKIVLNNFDQDLFIEMIKNTLYQFNKEEIKSLVQSALMHDKSQLFFALKQQGLYSIHDIDSYWLHKTLISFKNNQASSYYSRQSPQKTDSEIIQEIIKTEKFTLLMRKLEIVAPPQYAQFLKFLMVDLPREFANNEKEYYELVFKNALFQIGIKFNQEERKNLFFLACTFGFNESIKELLAAGVDANSKNQNDSTGLHFAATYLLKNTIELLINEGVDLNQRNKKGYTAFACFDHFRFKASKLPALKLLLPINSTQDFVFLEKDWDMLHELSALNISSPGSYDNNAEQLKALFDFFAENIPQSHNDFKVIENRETIGNYLDKFHTYGIKAAEAYYQSLKTEKENHERKKAQSIEANSYNPGANAPCTIM